MRVNSAYACLYTVTSKWAKRLVQKNGVNPMPSSSVAYMWALMIRFRLVFLKRIKIFSKLLTYTSACVCCSGGIYYQLFKNMEM